MKESGSISGTSSLSGFFSQLCMVRWFGLGSRSFLVSFLSLPFRPFLFFDPSPSCGQFCLNFSLLSVFGTFTYLSRQGSCHSAPSLFDTKNAKNKSRRLGPWPTSTSYPHCRTSRSWKGGVCSYYLFRSLRLPSTNGFALFALFLYVCSPAAILLPLPTTRDLRRDRGP